MLAPGERALLVAEELALDQFLRDRRAVDLDERPLHAVGVVVNRVGNQLLAGAVLALNQDVGVARRHALDQLEEVLHLLALTDDVGEAVLAANLLLELLVLGALLRPVDRLAEHVEEAVLADRLLEEVERARLPRLDRARDRALTADDDDFGRGIDFLEPPEQLDAVQVRQHQVGDDDVGPPLLEDLLAAGADERRPDLVALGFDDHLQPLGHRRLIIDGEHTSCGAWFGVAGVEAIRLLAAVGGSLPHPFSFNTILP